MPRVAKFPTERVFQAWVKKNLKTLGFEKALMEWMGQFHLITPDLYLIPTEGVIPFGNTDIEAKYHGVVRTELELLAYNFFDHGHNPDDVDVILVAEDNLRLYGVEPPKPLVTMKKMCTPTGHYRCTQQVKKVLERTTKSGVFNPSLWSTLRWYRPPDGQEVCTFCREAMVYAERKAHNTCLQQSRKLLQEYFDVQKKEVGW